MEQIHIEFGDEVKGVLFEVVEKILQTEKFKVRVEEGSKKGNFQLKKNVICSNDKRFFIFFLAGDNFLGIIYRIVFSTTDETRSSNLILKVAPIDETRRNQYHTRMCFLREMFMYEKV